MSAAAVTRRSGWMLAVLGAACVVPRFLLAAGADPQASLQSCASISGDRERLACYDRVARGAQNPSPPQAAPAAPPAATSSASPPSAAAPSVAVAPAAAPAAPAKQSFGLYSAEHPQLQVAGKLEASVVAMGRSAAGKMTVQLEGGAWWELEEADRLLAVGDRVTISRAALGSYLLQTPTKRVHHARRLS
jgi:hypothetical protein